MIYRIFIINLLDVVFILYIYCVNLVSFFLFDGKREAWLQPGVKANIKGALSVSVFNDKLDFSCRVSEMSEYVPQPYNG